MPRKTTKTMTYTEPSPAPPMTPTEAATGEYILARYSADFQNEAFKRNLTTVIEDLRGMAEKLERAVNDPSRYHSDPNKMVEHFLHTILWGVPNLGLDRLLYYAGNAKAATNVLKTATNRLSDLGIDPTTIPEG